MEKYNKEFDRIAIGDNIYLNFIENDKYKTNYLSFYFLTKLDSQTASYNTLISRLLTRGSLKYPTQRDMNSALDYCYDAQLESDVAKLGEVHSLNISICSLDNAFALDGEDITAKVIDILEDVILRPRIENGGFCEAYLSGEKQNSIDEIDAEINNKASYSRKRMYQVMCSREPYSASMLGDKEIIKNADAKELYSYYKNLLKSAPVEIFFVGRGDRDSITKRLSGFFAGVERSNVSLPKTSVVSTVDKVKEVTETMDINQAHLVMGFRTGIALSDKKFRALSLYNAVLGGSLTSKLFMNLREKLSLCYTVASVPDALKGVMLIYCGIDPKNREISINEAIRQMKAIEDGDITDKELQDSKNTIINSLKGLKDTPSVLAEWYISRVISGVFTSPDEVISEVRAITREDVVAVSKDIKLDTVYFLTGKSGNAKEGL